MYKFNQVDDNGDPVPANHVGLTDLCLECDKNLVGLSVDNGDRMEVVATIPVKGGKKHKLLIGYLCKNHALSIIMSEKPTVKKVMPPSKLYVWWQKITGNWFEHKCSDHAELEQKKFEYFVEDIGDINYNFSLLDISWFWVFMIVLICLSSQSVDSLIKIIYAIKH
jgi:hypothetical protein